MLLNKKFLLNTLILISLAYCDDLNTIILENENRSCVCTCSAITQTIKTTTPLSTEQLNTEYQVLIIGFICVFN